MYGDGGLPLLPTSHWPLLPKANTVENNPLTPQICPPQPIRTERSGPPVSAAIRLPLVWSLMQSDSSSHFSVWITSSSSDIGKNEHTSQRGGQMWNDWGCPQAAASTLLSWHNRLAGRERERERESGDLSEREPGCRRGGRWWRRRRQQRGAARFEAIGGDVKFAQTQGCCLNMLATNTAPVSLSSSLFSVTMYNQASSPRLLTMSFHIMLLHTRSCSQQAITQLLCLKAGAPFCRRCARRRCGSDGERVCCLLRHHSITGSGTRSSCTIAASINPSLHPQN